MPALLKQLAALDRTRRADALLALVEFAGTFGNPHLHGGIGIRQIQPKIFECRAGLHLRMIVRATPDSLIAEFIGNHDEIRRWLRALYYERL